MGVYNPHVPYVLGQEWVPIREEDFQFQPNVTSREVGYGFTLTASRQLNNARFYLNSPPPASSPLNQTAMVNVYPRGQETSSGPIRKVVIPVNNGAVTGSFITINGGATAASLADAVALPNDTKWVQCTKNTNPGQNESGQFDLFFATNDYTQVLNGKRILNVSLLYSGWGKQSQSGISIPVVKSATSASLNTIIVSLQIGSSSSTRTYGSQILGTFGSLKDMGNDPIQIASDDGRSAAVIARLDLGDVFTGRAVPNGPPTPWTLATLQKLDARNGINGFINVLTQVPEGNSSDSPNSVNFFYGYFALEVTYCEETRVAAGTQQFGYQNGVNVIAMADLNLNANPILAAGDYTATLSFVNPGDLAFVGIDLVGPYAPVNAIREKYQLNSMPGIEVDIPFPANEREGDSFSKVTTHIIPMVTLHASGAPLTEPHVYGRQAVAQIYGNVTASQNLLDSAVGSNQSFPWVRFYARRFGSTTTRLTLTGTSPTVSGSSVSITPTDFDALDEILDGWKEVTLRFTNAPIMGAGVTPTFTWSATGELAGNRWEVLGASAPAISGTVANEYLTLAPTASQLSPATYGQPAAGSTVAMTWMPGIAPLVSGSTLDATSDAVILFSQDMPTVTGFNVTVASQPLTGVSLDCASYPWYVPSAMNFNQITWSDTSFNVPVTGFGYYELQRMDSLTDWQTIAQLTSPTTASAIVAQDGFNRTETSSWGDPDAAPTGLTWSLVGGSSSEYNVTGGVGTVALPTPSTSRNTLIGLTSFSDTEAAVTVVLPQTALTDSYTSYLYARRADGNNYYTLNAVAKTSGSVDVLIQRRLAGTVTTLVTASASFTYAPGDAVGLRFRVVGTTLLGRVWNATTSTEPTTWTVTATDTTLSSGGNGIRCDRNSTNSNVGLVLSYDNYTLALPGFNDFEARVGLTSSYRVRAVNSLLFAGPWSSTGTATFSAPGVTGTGMGADARTLLFTTNSIQNGSSNLAYAMAFQSDTTEQFQFPEAGFTQFQFMYGRDFQTAFRPLERGGSTFSRTVLVQAAAISPPTLPDFTSLRDLAWDDLPYVCVRDEDGNRWLANVAVPSGRVEQNNRKIYLAEITVVEVTATAAVVTVTS